MSKEHLGAFIDAVHAIALTILALAILALAVPSELSGLILVVVASSFLMPAPNRYFLLALAVALFFEREFVGLLPARAAAAT